MRFGRLLPLIAVAVAAVACAAPAQADTLTLSGGPIVVRDNDVAEPYPATADVSTVAGRITSVTLTLRGVSHGRAEDLGVALVMPNGSVIPVMAGACGSGPLTDVDLVFRHAATPLPRAMTCAAGTYDVGSYVGLDFPDVDLDVWHGLSDPGGQVLGTYRLAVVDSTPGFAGDIDGWTLSVDYTPVTPAAMFRVAGPAMPYPVTTQVTGHTGWTRGIRVKLGGLTHTFVDDLQAMLVSPGGKAVWLVANAGGATTVDNRTLTFGESTTAIPDEDLPSTLPSVLAPSLYPPLQTLPAPAPAGPLVTLGSFAGTDVNGTWSLYAIDDEAGDLGWLESFGIEVVERNRAYVGIPPLSAMTYKEGATIQVRVTRSPESDLGPGGVRLQVVPFGRAAPVTDLAPADQPVSFAPGEVTKVVPVHVVADHGGEGAEMFRLKLAEPTGDASVSSGPGLQVGIAPDPRVNASSIVTMPSAKRCLRSPRLTLKFKRRADLVVTAVRVYVGNRRVSSRTGAAALRTTRIKLGKPTHRAWKVTVRIDLDTRRSVAARATYRACG
jgi:subtilisin-like proprotein convertase family protein